MTQDAQFDPKYGQSVELTPGIRRVTASNPGRFTYHGTNTYLLGARNMMIVDPGPDHADHIRTLLALSQGSTVEAILVTHTHTDHSPAARTLRELTGAPIVGCGPHKLFRDLALGETNPLDASSDKDHAPDIELRDGASFEAAGLKIKAIATPGHTLNHLCFQIANSDVLFSADHVMGWSTSIVAPPDGNMRAYMASLDKLLTETASYYLPGHGGPVDNGRERVQDLKRHRLSREQSILEELGSGPKQIREIVASLYADIDKKLHGAAGLSVFAHLEDLSERALVQSTPEMSLNAHFRLAP